MTEPDCLGPLDPGTTVSLEGIVWNESDGKWCILLALLWYMQLQNESYQISWLQVQG